jgi:threonine/homoserine/homoserine lactone efflux protein
MTIPLLPVMFVGRRAFGLAALILATRLALAILVVVGAERLVNLAVTASRKQQE